MKDASYTNKRLTLSGRKQRENIIMEQFFGALSDLTRGYDFEGVFIFIMKNEK